jgi:ATP-dependent RNA helicase SUPV3L1/SUV3
MAQLNRLDGDIDTLMQRIAHIRTWTYITHRLDWLDNAADWQERARGIEDRLSDALHERITQRFVDRRSAFLVRHLAGDGELLASVDKDGAVAVEGTHVGRLDGFRFVPDAAEGEAMRTLWTAANRVLRGEVSARARRLVAEADDAFGLDEEGRLFWRGGRVGRLAAGESALTPRVEVRGGDFLEGEAKERVRQRLQGFVRNEIERRLEPLFTAQALPLSGSARGLVYQLVDALGCLPADQVAPLVDGLDRAGRRALGRAGVRFGTQSVYLEPLLRPETVRFRALLWAVRHGSPVPPVPGARRQGRAIRRDAELPASFYLAIGWRPIDGLALRPDRLERLAASVRGKAKNGPFAADETLAKIAGVPPAALRDVLTALGYRAVIEAGSEVFVARPRRRSNQQPARARRPRRDNPFAKLEELKFA